MKVTLPATSPGNLSAAVLGALVEINRACWHAQQNQGSEGSPGLQVLLPKEIQFEVELITEDGLNAIERTTSSAAPEQRTNRTETRGAQRTTSETSGTTNATSATTSESVVGTDRSTVDERVENYEYESSN